MQGSERNVSFEGVVRLGGGGRAAACGVVAPLLTALVQGLSVRWGGSANETSFSRPLCRGRGGGGIAIKNE